LRRTEEGAARARRSSQFCEQNTQKGDRHPLKKFISTPQKVDRFPSKSHQILSIIMPSKFSS
jgi:hypothetical protein